MTKRFLKAYHLARYVRFTQQPGYQEEAQSAAFSANVAPFELERASQMVQANKENRLSAAIAYPNLWIAWRLLSSVSLRPRIPSQHNTKPKTGS